jgi:hypothetical protein
VGDPSGLGSRGSSLCRWSLFSWAIPLRGRFSLWVRCAPSLRDQACATTGHGGLRTAFVSIGSRETDMPSVPIMQVIQ